MLSYLIGPTSNLKYFIMSSSNEISSHDDTIEHFDASNSSFMSSDSSDSDLSSESSGDESSPLSNQGNSCEKISIHEILN